MKVDVEGWELEVLRGGKELLSRDDAPALCIEFSVSHPMAGGQPRDLFDLVIALGYDVYRCAKSKGVASPLVPVRSYDDLPEHDNLFCFKPAQRASLPAALFANVQ